MRYNPITFPSMDKKHLTSIGFGSFIKLFTLAFMCLGLVLGIILFIGSLFGGTTTAYIGTITFEGTTAGLVGLAIGPTIGGFIGLLYGLLAFLPFKLFLKIKKGIMIKVQFKGE